MHDLNQYRAFRARPLAAALLLALPPIAQAQITDLGTLGGAFSRASDVSADGSVVVGMSYTNNVAYSAFRWTSGGGMVNLGTLGGTKSWARGVSADGSVVVGEATTAGNATTRAFRWTSSGGMVNLGTLGGTNSYALGVSADGSVVVGEAYLADDTTSRAFRWTSDGGMVNLGSLGGTHSWASDVSADGSVVVGASFTGVGVTTRAFRWTNGGGMVSLGTLGGTNSYAHGVSADGSVVVGESDTSGNAATRAFRWTSGGGMVDLGTLGGTHSLASDTSADGSVVVGEAKTTGDTATRAFRWTQATGMQSVEDWLRAAGVSVPADITRTATATNSDGSVVVGGLTNNRAFIARVAGDSGDGGGGGGSGLVTLDDLQQSLSGIAQGGNIALATAGTVLNGAHSRPLSRRVATGQRAFWLAGDWGRDDHGTRNGDIGLAELGLGQNFGTTQINVSLGHTWAQQHLVLNGRANSGGTYLLAEALIPMHGNLWATLGGYGHWGEADLRRGYLNAGTQDYSTGTPDSHTWGLRARLEWDHAYHLASAGFSPYVDLTYNEAKLDAYTETGGGFPASFDARKEKATELRVGVNSERPLANGAKLFGTVEAAHRIEKSGARTSGNVIGLFGFNLAGQPNKQNWLRIGAGVEGKLADGRASLSLNATTKGEVPNAWLAAMWQKGF